MITFSSYLNSVREELHVFQSTLSKGICSESFLSRIEGGERKAPQLLREYLLGRLNIPTGSFHDYLQIQEYEAWQQRQNIIYKLICADTETVNKDISKFEKTIAPGDNISKQFCLYTKAQAGIIGGKRRKDMLPLYKEAMNCSMGHLLTDFDKQFDEALLCIQEYCVLAEYIASYADSLDTDAGREASRELNKLELILQRISDSPTDPMTTAQIYPLVAYIYSTIVDKFFKGDTEGYVERAREYGFKALEYMRSFQRIYYYKEIMDYLKRVTDDDDERRIICGEYEDFFNVLAHIYEEYSIDICMKTSAYVFVERGAHVIGNVILRRRKMLGITQGELREGICSEKTMYRIENVKSSIQDYTFKMLYERLKLVPEYVHGEIIADKVEAFEVYRRVKEANNNGDYEALAENLTRLKQLIHMDCAVNQQCWSRARNNWLRATGEITDEKYCANIKKLISFSIDDIDGTDPESTYLNDAEIMLVHNLSILDKKNRRKYLNLLIATIDDSEKEISLMTNFNLNAFIFSYYASELGNEEKYGDSGLISNYITDMGLRLRNLCYLADNIYNKYWNALQEGNASKSKLTECLEISRFMHNEAKERFFESKLNE